MFASVCRARISALATTATAPSIAAAIAPSSAAATTAFLPRSTLLATRSTPAFYSPPLRRTVAQEPVRATPGRAKYPILFVSMDGEKYPCEAFEGETLLQTAQRHALPIPGLCNGGGDSAAAFGEGPMCRSCHIYVDNEHLRLLPPKGEDEIALTEWIQNKNANSRFACEIIVDASCNGMTVVIPDYADIDIEETRVRRGQ